MKGHEASKVATTKMPWVCKLSQSIIIQPHCCVVARAGGHYAIQLRGSWHYTYHSVCSYNGNILNEVKQSLLDYS